jgi:hypothetical protein
MPRGSSITGVWISQPESTTAGVVKETSIEATKIHYFRADHAKCQHLQMQNNSI